MPLSPGKAPEYITASEWQPPLGGPGFKGWEAGVFLGMSRAAQHHKNVGTVDLGPKESRDPGGTLEWLVYFIGAFSSGCHPGDSNAAKPNTVEPSMGR